MFDPQVSTQECWTQRTYFSLTPSEKLKNDLITTECPQYISESEDTALYTAPLARIWRRTPRLTTEAERVTVQAPTSPSSCSFYSLQLYTYTPPHTRQLLLLILLFDILIAGFLRRRVFAKGHTRISTNCEQQSRLAKTACHKMHNGALKPSL